MKKKITINKNSYFICLFINTIIFFMRMFFNLFLENYFRRNNVRNLNTKTRKIPAGFTVFQPHCIFSLQRDDVQEYRILK